MSICQHLSDGIASIISSRYVYTSNSVKIYQMISIACTKMTTSCYDFLHHLGLLLNNNNTKKKSQQNSSELNSISNSKPNEPSFAVNRAREMAENNQFDWIWWQRIRLITEYFGIFGCVCLSSKLTTPARQCAFTINI